MTVGTEEGRGVGSLEGMTDGRGVGVCVLVGAAMGVNVGAAVGVNVSSHAVAPVLNEYCPAGQDKQTEVPVPGW